MKRLALPLAILGCTLLGAAAGVFLRSYQLTSCMDENGLLIFGSKIPLVLVIFSAVLVLALAVLCSRLKKTESGDFAFSPRLLPMLFTAVSAALLLFGCGMHLTRAGQSTLLLLLYGSGAVCGLLLFIAALLRFNEKKTPFLLLCLPVIFLVARLILDFKDWSHDPAVIDFAFSLLASICGMIALLNLSAFSIRIGKRRTTIFWSMLAVAFTAMTLPEQFLPGVVPDWSSLLIGCGLALWCGAHAVQLLFGSFPPAQVDAPAAPADDAVAEVPTDDAVAEMPTEPQEIAPTDGD